MNKTAIRNFAVWARNKLIADVSYHAGLLGITKNDISNFLPQSTKDVEFYDIGTAEPYAIRGEEIQQRKSLVDAIRAKEKDSNYEIAYNSLMEEVAYTWFNRLIAVRFMEVNDYLPEHVRVLSSESGKQEPDIVTTPFDAELFFAEGEQQKIIQMKNDNKLDEVFRILFIKQCRELSRILPRLFEGTNDYTELLLSLSFIDQEGVVYHLVHDIPEDDFNVEKGGQVEIIGWLYQYYNAELKDETFALLKNNVKVTKERIPSATQLFTPDWIVRYMVENSLGRLWVEGHPNDVLKSGWKYYLDEADQEVSVKEELEKIRSEYAKLNPEDIKVIDPCMGSGHILVYAFDVLMQIYESAGYTQRDAAKSILEHNLFGLDIDDRAAQLAYFAIMMKARQYNRRILDGETNCNVYAIKESNNFDRNALVKIGDDLHSLAIKLLDAFVDAKEYGSIISIDLTLEDLDRLEKRLDDVDKMSDYGNLMDVMYAGILCKDFDVFIKQARIMVQKYDAVITNPPYMGAGNMDAKLSEFAKRYFPDAKSDMSTIFMDKCIEMSRLQGFVSMINIPVWMFITSYEKLRNRLIDNNQFVSMLHLGRGVFGSDFGTTAFILKHKKTVGYKSTYLRLFNEPVEVVTVEKKEEWFFQRKGFFVIDQDKLLLISGTPIAYWISDNAIKIFEQKSIYDIASVQEGLKTGDNERFIRLWYEVDSNKTNVFGKNNTKWIYHTKGGDFRKWYGNRCEVLNFENDGCELRAYKGASLSGYSNYFKAGITYNRISSSKTGFRYTGDNAIPNMAGLMLYVNDEEKMLYCLAWLNSEVIRYLLNITNPTINFPPGTIGKLPFELKDEISSAVSKLTQQNVDLSKDDWDSFETSWDFKKHPLI